MVHGLDFPSGLEFMAEIQGHVLTSPKPNSHWHTRSIQHDLNQNPEIQSQIPILKISKFLTRLGSCRPELHPLGGRPPKWVLRRTGMGQTWNIGRPWQPGVGLKGLGFRV